jgi:Fe-S-cluster containining protein
MHTADLSLYEKGILTREHLITVRRGELVQMPYQQDPVVASDEFVKIAGKGKSWDCFFFDEETDACTIYVHQPVSCSLFKCWQTEDIEKIIGQDLVQRFDFVRETPSLPSFILYHEKTCPLPDFAQILLLLKQGRFPEEGAYDGLLNEDLLLRQQAVETFSLSVAEEVFLFGRPLFQLFQQLGGRVEQLSEMRIRLFWS